MALDGYWRATDAFPMKSNWSGIARILMHCSVLTFVTIGGFWILGNANQATGQEPEPDPLVELAPYMGELQRLTHKLSLSVANGNTPLASFYLYESLETLEDIKVEVPEYRGLPIALLVDQLSTPKYEELKRAIAADEKEEEMKHTPAALNAVISSCNQCHSATQHGFIKITNGSEVNPFNQDFKP